MSGLFYVTSESPGPWLLGLAVLSGLGGVLAWEIDTTLSIEI